MSGVHPGGLARTERLHSAATKMTCHTLKGVESVQASSCLRASPSTCYQKRREREITDEGVQKFHLSPRVSG